MFSSPLILTSGRRLCHNAPNAIDVMLSRTKHLVLSGCYEDEILRLHLQDDITTHSQGREGTIGSRKLVIGL